MLSYQQHLLEFWDSADNCSVNGLMVNRLMGFGPGFATARINPLTDLLINYLNLDCPKNPIGAAPQLR